MGVGYNPKIVSDGLVMCLDAGNTKSYPTYLPNSYSNYFDGNGDFITFPANAAFNFGTGSFTIEAWVYLSGNSPLGPNNTRDAQIFDVSTTNTDSLFFLILGNSTTTGTGLTLYNGSVSVTVTTTIPQNQWNHIAVVKSGTSVYFFVNGTQVGTTQTTSGNWGSSTFVPKIGGRGPDTSTFNFYLNGYISNLRVLKGTALYTANFTVPTSPLTNIVNTSLLTCQSSTFVDNSTNNFSATVNGNTSVQSVNPFLIWADMSGKGNSGTLTNCPSFNSTNGGSIVFNGINHRVATASTTIGYLSGGTFEVWLKRNASVTDQGFLTHNQSYPFINLWMPGTGGIAPGSAGKMRWEILSASGVGVSLYSTTVFAVATWYHVVATFDTSNSAKIYVNGVLDNQATGTAVPTTCTSVIYVGDYGIGNYPSNSNIAVAKVYNRTLSATEIQQNFNALRGRFGI